MSLNRKRCSSGGIVLTKWSGTFNRDTNTAASFWKVVPDGQVLGTSVVPHRDGVLLPLKSTLEGGTLDVLEKKLEQPLAFSSVQSVNTPGKSGIYVERLFSGDGMSSYHRVGRLRG